MRGCFHTVDVWWTGTAPTLVPVAVDALAGVHEVNLHHLVLVPAQAPQPSGQMLLR